MDFLPYLNQSISPLPVFPKSAASKHRSPVLQLPDALDNTANRKSITPSKHRQNEIDQELLRLNEQLDFEEISLSCNTTTEKQIEKSLKLYEKYIEGLISCLSKINSRLSKSFDRGWLAYRSLLGKLKSSYSLAKNLKDLIETGVQVDLLNKATDDSEKCISLLKSLISKTNTLNNSKVIKILKQLTIDLQPIDIPEYSQNLEPQPIEFILTSPVSPLISLSTYSDPSAVINKLKFGRITITREIQTSLRLPDVSALESLKITLSERDKVIQNLTQEVKSAALLKKSLEIKHSELEEQKELLRLIELKGCKKCNELQKHIEGLKAEIRNFTGKELEIEELQAKIERNKIINKELVVVAGRQNEKIIELTDGIEKVTRLKDEILKKIELESRLLKGEKPRVKSVGKVKKEAESVAASWQSYGNEFKQNANHSLTPVEMMHNEGFISPILTPLPRNKQVEFNQSLGGRFEVKVPKVSFSVTKRSRALKRFSMKNVMNMLKISKEDYQMLSSNAKMEIFEALYEHRSKCGPDCWHLKKAMEIRWKEKALLYPTKKYNIVKS